MRTIRERTNNADEDDGAIFRIAMLIRSINGQLNASIAGELSETGLTMPQMLTIKAIAHSGALTVSQLANELAVGKSTMVGIVDRLERAGLVERHRETGDRREVMVGFAEAAKGRIASIKSVVGTCFMNAFRGIDREDLAGIGETLEKLSKAFGIHTSDGAAPEGDARKGE